MSIERTIPFRDGMELGLGMDDLTGQVGSLDAVSFTESGSPAADSGMEATYDTSLINSAEQLYSQLNVDVAAEGRYGLFSAEGKFAFAENSRFSSTATFLVARARVQTAFVRVRNPVPVPDAQALVRDGKQEKFRQRYGDLFIRGIKSGGEFVAVLSITSSVKSEERELAVSLKASFDGVVAGGSVDTAVRSRQEELRSRSEVRVSIYQRGGSGDEISYVGTVDEVMARLKGFAKSVQGHPKAYTVQAASYDTLVFDDEPNWFDLARAREVLEDAMRKRVVLQTARNDVEAVLAHPSYFLTPPPAASLATAKALLGDSCFLNNKPLRKAPHCDARLKFEVAVGCGRRRTESQRRNADYPLELLHETRLLNQRNLIHVVVPIIQPGNDDRGVGQVHHRTRAKRGDDLTGT